jgi:hypothetical protein
MTIQIRIAIGITIIRIINKLMVGMLIKMMILNHNKKIIAIKINGDQFKRPKQ